MDLNFRNGDKDGFTRFEFIPDPKITLLEIDLCVRADERLLGGVSTEHL